MRAQQGRRGFRIEGFGPRQLIRLKTHGNRTRGAIRPAGEIRGQSAVADVFTDRQFMELAIAQARQCKPDDPDRIPMVGTVIVKNGKILAMGSRQPDTHAEKHALDQVADKTALAGATVYTTLEPCTPAVRSKPHESCTKLLLGAQLGKVVIGILDPNQQVCGRGVLELQEHNVQVELFPHDLAVDIRLLNERFIRTQRTLGVEFLDPQPGATLCTYLTGGRHTFRCRCINDPGSDIFVFVERNGMWWPQTDRLRHVEADDYQFDCTFGSPGIHTVHIVRGNDLGIALYAYYRRVVDRNRELRRKIEARGTLVDALAILTEVGEYPGIPMPKLPRGLDSQGSISVEVAAAPAKP
jgi:pyrimidine deaminase RibD-like protein